MVIGHASTWRTPMIFSTPWRPSLSRAGPCSRQDRPHPACQDLRRHIQPNLRTLAECAARLDSRLKGVLSNEVQILGQRHVRALAWNRVRAERRELGEQLARASSGCDEPWSRVARCQSVVETGTAEIWARQREQLRLGQPLTPAQPSARLDARSWHGENPSRQLAVSPPHGVSLVGRSRPSVRDTADHELCVARCGLPCHHQRRAAIAARNGRSGSGHL